MTESEHSEVNTRSLSPLYQSILGTLLALYCTMGSGDAHVSKHKLNNADDVDTASGQALW